MFIPHEITPLSESEFPAITIFFFLFLFLRNNPFGFITWPFVGPDIVLVCHYSEVIVGWVWLYIQSQWETMQLLGEASSARGHPDVPTQKPAFPKSWVFR